MYFDRSVYVVMQEMLAIAFRKSGGKFTPRFLNAFAGYKVSVRRVQRAALSSGR